MCLSATFSLGLRPPNMVWYVAMVQGVMMPESQWAIKCVSQSWPSTLHSTVLITAPVYFQLPHLEFVGFGCLKARYTSILHFCGLCYYISFLMFTLNCCVRVYVLPLGAWVPVTAVLFVVYRADSLLHCRMEFLLTFPMNLLWRGNATCPLTSTPSMHFMKEACLTWLLQLIEWLMTMET